MAVPTLAFNFLYQFDGALQPATPTVQGVNGMTSLGLIIPASGFAAEFYAGMSGNTLVVWNGGITFEYFDVNVSSWYNYSGVAATPTAPYATQNGKTITLTQLGWIEIVRSNYGFDGILPYGSHQVRAYMTDPNGSSLTDLYAGYVGGVNGTLRLTLNPTSPSPTVVDTTLAGPGSDVFSHGVTGLLGTLTGDVLYIVRRDPNAWALYQEVLIQASTGAVLATYSGLAAIPDHRIYSGVTYAPLNDTYNGAVTANMGMLGGYFVNKTLPVAGAPPARTPAHIFWDCQAKCSEYI